jgi:predicted Zn-dependent peptidase
MLTDTPGTTDDEATAPEDVLERVPPTGAVVEWVPPTDAVVDVAGIDPFAVLATRPSPAAPRPYHFPRLEREVLDGGLTVVRAHLPGRSLLLAQLLLAGSGAAGAAAEPDELGGVTVLMARAMPEGTSRRSAVELVEAAERLGAELTSDAGWDSLSTSVEVPRARLGPALGLLAEMALEPSFPEHEVERLRDERLNDLMQARADARRRAERVFPETVYAADAAYRRPLAGTEETVVRLDRDAVAARHAALVDPAVATLIVAGDLEGVPVLDLARDVFRGWSAAPLAAGTGVAAATPAPPGRRVVLVDRPGAPQSEVRFGHVGVPRRIPAFHAVSVLNAILGGLFGSRLSRLLREERGYTYGVNTSFEMRRAAGPFAVRCAVHTEATAPAVVAIDAEVRRIREAPVTPDELQLARDYLVGVFPLRFETAAQVAGAIAGLVAFDLPDDELDRYRDAVAAVTVDDVLAAARAHLRPDDAAAVIVGDVAAIEADIRAARLGEVSVVRDVVEAAPAGDEGVGGDGMRGGAR